MNTLTNQKAKPAIENDGPGPSVVIKGGMFSMDDHDQLEKQQATLLIQGEKLTKPEFCAKIIKKYLSENRIDG